MYGIVLATALTAGTTAADFGFWKHGHGCHGSCYSGCYSCFSNCNYCGGCHGCWTTCGCYGCYGYCGGWSCCGGCCSCVASACYGCSSCYGCSCYGCSSYGCSCYGGCAAMAAPIVSYGCAGCASIGGAPVGGTIIDGGAIIEGEVSAKRSATLVVKADRNVQIKVNGQETPRSGSEDSYNSPALTPGRTYAYTVVAEFNKNGEKQTETKEVIVQAGRRSVVDFSSLTSVVSRKESKEGSDEKSPASVTVIAPEKAKVSVNDVVINIAGKQTFQTPALEKGKKFFYTFKAEIEKDGKTATETRRVDVAAGKEITVDFTKADPVLTASR